MHFFYCVRNTNIVTEYLSDRIILKGWLIMNENTPNDSILLPEGIVEDDASVLWLNRAYSDIVTGELLKEEKEKKRGERQ